MPGRERERERERDGGSPQRWAQHVRSLSAGATCILTGGWPESGLKAFQLFSFKKLTEAASGPAIKTMEAKGTDSFCWSSQLWTHVPLQRDETCCRCYISGWWREEGWWWWELRQELCVEHGLRCHTWAWVTHGINSPWVSRAQRWR